MRAAARCARIEDRPALSALQSQPDRRSPPLDVPVGDPLRAIFGAEEVDHMSERGGGVGDGLAGRGELGRADADPAARVVSEVAIPVGVAVGTQPHRPVRVREPGGRLVRAAGLPTARHQDDLLGLPKGALELVYLKVILSVVLSVTCCLSRGLLSAFVKPGSLSSCHCTKLVGQSTFAEMPSTATTAV